MGLDHGLRKVNSDEDIITMRKANHIHAWFLNNCKHAEDNDIFPVTRDELLDFKQTAQLIVDSYDKADKEKIKQTKSVHSGFSNGEPIYTELASYPIDEAEKLMPTQSGFFFGNTNYTEWYYEDLRDLLKALEPLKLEALEDNEIVAEYWSWW